MSYLLDTNILSGLLHDPTGSVAKQIRRHGMETVCTSIVVACEMRFGALKHGSMRLISEIEGLFARLQVMPFEAPADRFYAELRADSVRSGKPIGGNDMFIAAHALALGYTLVTANEREFSQVKTLRIENWLR